MNVQKVFGGMRVPQKMFDAIQQIATLGRKLSEEDHHRPGIPQMSWNPPNPRGKDKSLGGFYWTEGLYTKGPECDFVTISDGESMLSVKTADGTITKVYDCPESKIEILMDSLQEVVYRCIAKLTPQALG